MMTAAWIPMMPPSALPAIARRVGDRDGVLAAPPFAGSCAGIWALVGLAVHAPSPRSDGSPWRHP